MQSESVGNTQDNFRAGGGNKSASRDDDMYHSDKFYEFCAELTQHPSFRKLCEGLNVKTYTVKDGDTTYRIINHWTRLGLFDDERPDDSMDWRKLSLKDIVWLRMARDLRKFGLPLDALKLTYKSLWKRRYGSEKRIYPWLEIAILMCRLRMPALLVVLEDGYAEITTPEGLAMSDPLNGMPSLIRLNVNNIWREIVGDKTEKYKPESRLAFELNNGEIAAYAAMQSADTGAVKVHIKDGCVTQFDTTKEVDGAERIVDVINEIEYGELIVKIAKGKPVYTQMMKTEKPKK